MYKLFTDKTEIFECKIQLEGASIKNSQARLLIESENLSLVFNSRTYPKTAENSESASIPTHMGDLNMIVKSPRWIIKA